MKFSNNALRRTQHPTLLTNALPERHSGSPSPQSLALRTPHPPHTPAALPLHSPALPVRTFRTAPNSHRTQPAHLVGLVGLVGAGLTLRRAGS